MSLSLRVSFLWVIYFLIVQKQRIIEMEVKQWLESFPTLQMIEDAGFI